MEVVLIVVLMRSLIEVAAVTLIAVVNAYARFHDKGSMQHKFVL